MIIASDAVGGTSGPAAVITENTVAVDLLKNTVCYFWAYSPQGASHLARCILAVNGHHCKDICSKTLLEQSSLGKHFQPVSSLMHKHFLKCGCFSLISYTFNKSGRIFMIELEYVLKEMKPRLENMNGTVIHDLRFRCT